MTRPSIGFIGLGAMGLPMARHLLHAGYPLHVHNRSNEVLDLLSSEGAHRCGSPEEIARLSDIILLSLPDSQAVESVVQGPRGLLAAEITGKILIDLSSSRPESTRRLARLWARSGGDMLDAPVSGGPAGAAAGTLSIMVGGERDVLERCRPVLETLGSRIFHIGEVGSGHTMKAVNNLLFGTLMVASCEAVALGAKAGLDPAKMIEVISHSSGRNYAIDVKFKQKVLNRDFSPGFTTDLLHKDMAIALDLAREMGLDLTTSSDAIEILGIGQAQGFGSEDYIALIKWYESRYGILISEK